MSLPDEVTEAIKIADKHLAGQPAEKRRALADDIARAIVQHAGKIANDALTKSFEKARKTMAKGQS